MSNNPENYPEKEKNEEKCKTCNGTGHLPNNVKVTCPTCKGAGQPS